MAKSVRRKSAPRSKTPSSGSAGEGKGEGNSSPRGRGHGEGGSAVVPASRPSSLLDTRVIYCGDCLEQLRSLPDGCVDLIYIDPPFSSSLSLRAEGNSNRNVRGIHLVPRERPNLDQTD